MSTTTGIYCPGCNSPYIEKAKIGYFCKACLSTFVVHSEDKKVVAYELPPETINPPQQMVADGDVVRCTTCGRLSKNLYGATHWCTDYRTNNVEHNFIWFNNVKLAKKCKSCGCWVYPSFDRCSNQQCNDFGSRPVLYVNKKDNGKWEEYTPISDPPAPATQPIETPKEKFGCSGCGPVAFVLTLIFILLTVWSFNAWKNWQANESAHKEHERVMSLRPWDNQRLAQDVYDNLSKEDKDWINDWTKGKDTVWTPTDYQVNHPENMWGRVTITVSPKNPGDFKSFQVYSDWGRNDQGRWEITSDGKPFIQVP